MGARVNEQTIDRCVWTTTKLHRNCAKLKRDYLTSQGYSIFSISSCNN